MNEGFHFRYWKVSLWALFVIFTLIMPKFSHAALAYRSKTFSTSASASTGVTATAPAGATQNDILFAFFLGNGAITVTPPAGWTSLVSLTPSGNQTVKLYWIRQGASAPSYNFTWNSTTYYELSITAWSGAVTSGNPYDVFNFNTPTIRSPGNPNPPAVTTTVANTLVIGFGTVYQGFNTGGATPPSGYTLVTGGAFEDLGIAYKAVAAIGTEDPGAFTNSYPSNSDVTEITVALKPEVATKVKHRVISM